MFIRLGKLGFGTPELSPEELNSWRGYDSESRFEGAADKTILMLGGFGISGPFVFEEAAREINQRSGARVVVVNLAGNDGSYRSLQWADAELIMQEAEAKLIALAREAGTKITLVGFSTGALVAASLAGRQPELVRGCAIVSPPLRMKRKLHEGLMRFAHFTYNCPFTYPLFWWWRWYWMRTPSKSSDSMTDRQRKLPQLRWTPGASATSIRSLQLETLEHARTSLEQSGLPILIAHGRRDGKAPFQDTEALAEVLAGPNTSFVPFESSGHTISIGRESAQFRQVLGDWLESVWARS